MRGLSKMSKLKEIKNLVENLGYILPSGYWGHYGIIIELVGIRHGKLDTATFHIEPSNPEYAEVFRYVFEKLGIPKKH